MEQERLEREKARRIADRRREADRQDLHKILSVIDQRLSSWGNSSWGNSSDKKRKRKRSSKTSDESSDEGRKKEVEQNFDYKV